MAKLGSLYAISPKVAEPIDDIKGGLTAHDRFTMLVSSTRGLFSWKAFRCVCFQLSPHLTSWCISSRWSGRCTLPNYWSLTLIWQSHV